MSQTWGRSPVCVRMCRLRRLGLSKTLPQWSQGNMVLLFLNWFVTYLLSKKPAYLGGFFGCWGSIWDTEKGIGEGEGEGGRECELKREGETETGWGGREGESIEEGGATAVGSKAIGFDVNELERSNGLSCRTDSMYLWASLIMLPQTVCKTTSWIVSALWTGLQEEAGAGGESYHGLMTRDLSWIDWWQAMVCTVVFTSWFASGTRKATNSVSGSKLFTTYVRGMSTIYIYYWVDIVVCKNDISEHAVC